MKTRSLASAAALMLAAGMTRANAQTRTDAPDWAAFDKYVANAAKAWRVPALAIAIVKDDSLVFAKGYGVLETGTTKPADAHTRFAIGSTTKAMTSAALAMLVDEGKIRWDEHVIDILPEFQLWDPYVTRELTIRDLLTHRSGLAGTDLLWALNGYTMPEMMRRLRYVKPTTSFRSEWQYQNNMYAIGGVIVERVSGMSWDAFIRSRIFVPLGMTESEPLVSMIKGKPNVSVPHVLRNDTVRVVPMRSTDAIAPAGSVWSSVTDMSKWMRFILDSGRVGSQRLITVANFRELITPQIRAPINEYPALQLARPTFFSYGLGWFVQDYQGQAVWMHTGSIDGEIAIIGLMPQKRVGVYVLGNLDHAELRHALMYAGFDLYNGGPKRDWSAEVQALFASMRRGGGGGAGQPARRSDAKPSLPLEKYVGTYADSAYGTVAVTLSANTLHAKIITQPDAELEYVDYETFRTRSADPTDGQTPVTFVPDGAGNVTGVRVLGIVFGRVRTR
ncbi:MAG: serine hydrolase [Gemmatimonadota bacterium]|nr:serine hydrolase [Gemmatimonadota bacterium]